MPDERQEKSAEDAAHSRLGRAFAEAAELLAEQPRRMAEEFRKLGESHKKTASKITHGIRRTSGRIG